MATIKQRLHRKNSSNTYDTIHLETSADLITGTLPVSHGGTGMTTNPSLAVNLASGSAAGIFTASPRPGVTGTLPIAHGGTGATTAANARTALGAAASSHNHSASQITSGTLSVARGGTGVTSINDLKTVLGINSSGGNIASKIVIGTYKGTHVNNSTPEGQKITISGITELLAVLVIAMDGSLYFKNDTGIEYYRGGLATKNQPCTCDEGDIVSISGVTFTVYSESGPYTTDKRRAANDDVRYYNYIAFGN